MELSWDCREHAMDCRETTMGPHDTSWPLNGLLMAPHATSWYEYLVEPRGTHGIFIAFIAPPHALNSSQHSSIHFHPPSSFFPRHYGFKEPCIQNPTKPPQDGGHRRRNWQGIRLKTKLQCNTRKRNV